MVASCSRKTFQSHPIGRRDSRENKSGVPSDVVSRRRTAPHAPDGTRTRTPNRAWDAANYITGAARRAGVGPAPMVLETMILPLDHRHIGGMSYGMPLRAVYGSRTRVCGLGSRRTDRCTNTARNRGRRAKGDQKKIRRSGRVPRMGFEPTTFRSGGGRPIHWATEAGTRRYASGVSRAGGITVPTGVRGTPPPSFPAAEMTNNDREAFTRSPPCMRPAPHSGTPCLGPSDWYSTAAP